MGFLAYASGYYLVFQNQGVPQHRGEPRFHQHQSMLAVGGGDALKCSLKDSPIVWSRHESRALCRSWKTTLNFRTQETFAIVDATRRE